MKTKEELNAIKKEFESVNMKLEELTDDELNNVVGGMKALKLSTSKRKMISASVDYVSNTERTDIQPEIEEITQQIDEDAFLY